MKKTFKTLLFLSSLAAFSACNLEPPGKVVNRSDPERFLDNSSELITFKLSSKGVLSKISSTISKDKPTSAELKCSLLDVRCAQAKEMLERRKVPISFSSEYEGVVYIHYDRMIVQDCDPSYADNSTVHRSENHPAFGCAVTGNALQMITDKKQILLPNLSDFPDAEKGEQVFRAYRKAPEVKELTSDLKSGG